MNRNGAVCRAGETVEQYIERLESEKKQVQNDKHAGYIYILQCEYGYYKIGQTVDPHRRFTELGKKYQFKWQVVSILPSQSCWAVEYELLQQFKDKRVRGWKDWFTLSNDDIELIKAAVK